MDGALDFIGTALGNGGRVLVHCAGGTSRSGAVVLAHVLATRAAATVDEALALIQARRPTVGPNWGFLEQLKRLEQRPAAAAPPPAAAPPAVPGLELPGAFGARARPPPLGVDTRAMYKETRSRPVLVQP